MIHLTSDTHFNHANIIRYCNRPWSSVEEMNEGLIRNWNERVKPGDTVIHVGDFAMGNKKHVPDIRARLNGRIELVMGNHDRQHRDVLHVFDAVHKDLVLELDGKQVFIHHEPMPKVLWPSGVDLHLCGHVHESWAEKDDEFNGWVINVGVDVRGWRPVTFQELLAQSIHSTP